MIEVFIALFVILCAVGAYVGLKTPKVLKISRSQLIHAPAAVLFRYINDPRLIQGWNPFMEGDATVQLNFTGPAEGVGAQWSWEGKKAGIGSAAIVASEPFKRVSLRLDFKKPFEVTNFGEYVLAEQGSATEVQWTIDESALIPRVLSCFIDLDKLIGGQFEKGLAKLKALVEERK